MKKVTLTVFAGLLASYLSAQDIHWSQPSSALLYQNPAFTGIYGKFSVGANYRSQWNAVNTPYTTYMISGDYRFGKSTDGPATISAGGIVYNDVAGDGHYRTTGGSIMGSCLVRTSKKIYVGAGLAYSLIQSSLHPNKFTWGSQFDGQKYNPGLTSGETEANVSRFLSDLNAGVALRYDKSGGSSMSRSDTKWLFGYSINHLARPDMALNGSVDRLNIKHTMYAGGIGSISEFFALKPTLLFYMQGRQLEITTGTLARFTVGQQSLITGYKKAAAFSIGALYRLNDAVIPTMEFEKGGLQLGLSYDINVSSLHTASNLRGGIEFTIRFADMSKYLYKDKPNNPADKTKPSY